MSANWRLKRELTGPICPCGRPMTRRRYWRTWDRVRCKRCRRVAECVRALFGKPESFVFSPPPHPQTPDGSETP